MRELIENKEIESAIKGNRFIKNRNTYIIILSPNVGIEIENKMIRLMSRLDGTTLNKKDAPSSFRDISDVSELVKDWKGVYEYDSEFYNSTALNRVYLQDVDPIYLRKLYKRIRDANRRDSRLKEIEVMGKARVAGKKLTPKQAMRLSFIEKEKR